MKTNKIFSYISFASSIILLIFLMVFVIFFTLFGLGSGVGIFVLLPLFILTLVGIGFLIFSIFFSYKIIKNKPLPITPNKILSKILIFIAVAIFLRSLVLVIFNNVSGFNPGGFIPVILAFLVLIILMNFALALKEKK